MICGLGVYAGRGGPVGRGLGELAASALGWLRLALPPLLALGGAALILRRGDVDAGDEDAQPSAAAHVAVGTALLVVAVAGVLHVTGGRPRLDAPVEQLRDAGGWLGVGVGGRSSAWWARPVRSSFWASSPSVASSCSPARAADRSTACSAAPAR